MAARGTAWAMALVLAAATPAQADFWHDLEEAVGLMLREKKALQASPTEEVKKAAPPAGASAAQSAPANRGGPSGTSASNGSAGKGTGSRDATGSAGADIGGTGLDAGGSVGGALDGATDAIR